MSVGPVHAGHQGSPRNHEHSAGRPARTYQPPSSGQRLSLAVSGLTDPQHHRAKTADHSPQFVASADFLSSADTWNLGTSRAEAEAAQSDDLAAQLDLPRGSLARTVPAGGLHVVGGAPLLTADLYLLKAGISVTPESLAALYDADRRAPAVTPVVRSAELDVTPLLASSAAIAYPLAQPALAKLSATLSAADALDALDALDAPTAGEGSERAHTQQLLDLGLEAPVRRYGSIPVIVSGQLIELQFVALPPRQGAAASPMLRRLNLTLKTPSLGSVQVTAETHGDQLNVMFAGTYWTSEELAAHTGGVGELLARLGWQADSVTFVVGDTHSAARPKLQAQAGTLDQWL